MVSLLGIGIDGSEDYRFDFIIQYTPIDVVAMSNL